MRFTKIGLAALYTVLALGAIPAMADRISYDALEALRIDDMRKMAMRKDPIAISKQSFTTEDGTEKTLADYQGKVILVNFWATWCAPCRAEMPSLDALEAELGGDDFAVVTIATGRNPLPAIKSFFSETNVVNLPILLDPRQSLALNMGVRGLPASVLIDRDGMELGRLTGDADWHGEAAVNLIKAVIEASKPEDS